MLYSKLCSSVSGRLYPVPEDMPSVLCIQCFDAVGWAAGRASSL